MTSGRFARFSGLGRRGPEVPDHLRSALGDRAGDVLSTVTRVADIRDAGRNELMTMVSEVTAADGERVATTTSTLVSRGTAESKDA